MKMLFKLYFKRFQMNRAVPDSVALTGKLQTRLNESRPSFPDNNILHNKPKFADLQLSHLSANIAFLCFSVGVGINMQNELAES